MRRPRRSSSSSSSRPHLAGLESNAKLSHCWHNTGVVHSGSGHTQPEGQPAAASLWTQLKHTATVSDELYTVDSWLLLGMCFLAAAASITSFNVLQGGMVAAAVEGGFQASALPLLSTATACMRDVVHCGWILSGPSFQV